jgi:uncharacterized protein
VIDLTEYAEAVNAALAEGSPCVVATASAEGAPSLGYKGSVMVFDREHLAFWERTLGETLAHLRENPRVAVLYRSRERNLHLRFHGHATLHESGDMREQIMARTVEAELNRDPERKGIGVLVRVDRVTAPGRGPLQTR